MSIGASAPFHVATTQDNATRQAYLLLVILSVVNLFNFMDRVLFSVVLEPIKNELELSDTQMGMAGGIAFALAYGLSCLVMGRLADTRNRIVTLGGAMSLWSVASALTGFASGFIHLLATRAMVGIGVSACSPCSQSLIGDSFPPEKRSLALGIYTGIGTMGTLIGVVAGGLLAEAYGWRYAFIILAVPSLIFLPITFLYGREPQRGTFDDRPVRNLAWIASVKRLLSSRTVVYLLIGLPLLMFIAGMATWIPAYLQRAYDASAAEIGTYGGASLGIGLVTGTFAGGVIVNRLRRGNEMWEFWWPAVAMAVSTPLMAAFLVAESASSAYVLLFLAYFAGASAFGPALACMLVASEPETRGTMAALGVLGSSLFAYGIGPALIGFLSDVMISYGFGEENGESLQYVLMGALVIPALSSVIFIASGRCHAKGI